MKCLCVLAALALVSPAAGFMVSKSVAPALKPAMKNNINLHLGSRSGRQGARFELAMSGRVPFIAGNWKMNPETVEQVSRKVIKNMKVGIIIQ
jgi:hypothetical protein